MKYILEGLLLGIALALDAFSVSAADALNEPKMKKSKMLFICSSFGVFQAIMPLIGWLFIHYLAKTFTVIEKITPWIAFLLLLYIGVKMIIGSESKSKNDSDTEKSISYSTIIVQAVATSIDAMSVGFAIALYSFQNALIESSVIGIVTFVLSILGFYLGKILSNKVSRSASIIGGIILLLIGINILLESFFG